MEDYERTNYSTMKEYILDAYYDFCRDDGINKRSPQLEVLAHVGYEFEVCFKLPVEQLMNLVIQLVLAGSWYEKDTHLTKLHAQKIICQYGLDKLLEGLPADEVEIFMLDLKVLGFA